jgi:hypothetical protein
MSALEVGTLGDGGAVGGDGQLGTAWCRTFATASPAGFPCLVTVYAYAALVHPYDDADDPAAMRDMLEHTEVSTYLHGAELDGEPFDSETTYEWPIGYWPASTLDAHEQPTLEALDATARAHLRGLSAAWLASLPAPPAGFIPDGTETHTCE